MISQNIRDEFLSPFYDKSVVHAWLENKPILRNAAREFAAAFGVQMAVSPTWTEGPNGPSVAFYTKEGLPAGLLSYLRSGYTSHSNKPFFKYKSPIVSKERATGRSQRDERDSEKITGIISALKRNDEIPSLDNIKKYFYYGIHDAFQTVAAAGRHGPAVSLTTDQSRALLKYFFEDDKMSIESHRMSLRTKYDSYLKEMEKYKDSASNVERFRKGCMIIGIISDKMIPDTYYIVGDGVWDSNKNMTLENVVRYKSLAESPLAGDAAMIRTYFEGKPQLFTKENEIGISCTDTYFEDIDVAVGYRRYDQGTWVLIPKHGL